MKDFIEIVQSFTKIKIDFVHANVVEGIIFSLVDVYSKYKVLVTLSVMTNNGYFKKQSR